jgi:uncharacterized protein involved in exopolysaccharide biosynthesis
MALASQFGVSVGGGDELSPAFYSELLPSREILLSVAETDFQVDGATVLLADLLEIEEDTGDLRLKRVIEWLRESAVSVSTGPETGIVTVEVTTHWPELSLQIAERLLAEISRFNLETRQSQAAAERSFIEERVENARADLEVAEDERQSFLQANRQFESSPRSGVPIRAAPAERAGPDERRGKLFLALGLVLGGMGGTVLAFVVEGFASPGGNDPTREDFQRTLDGFLSSFGLRKRAAQE